MSDIIAKYEKYTLCKEKDFYSIGGLNYIGMSGTKEDVKKELIRWRDEIDFNNDYMINMENYFINILSE